MNCPSCGKNIADNAKFCNSCGAAITPVQASIPPQQPAPTPARKVGKLKFLSTLASPKTKKTNLASWIVGAICTVLLSYSFITFYFSPVYDWAILELIAPDDTDELKDKFDEARDEYKKHKEKFDDLEGDELIEELESYFDTSIDDDINTKKLLKRTDAVTKTPSLHNMKSFIDMFEEFSSKLWGNDVDEDTLEIFDTISNVLIIVYVALMLLTLLATLFKKTGLAILVQFLAAIFTFLSAGITPTLILFTAFIVLAVMCKLINKEYKAYRNA